MAGSSGGGYSGRRHRTVQQGLSDADINRCLRELLREYNEQEREAINRHLDVLRDSLELTDDDVIRFIFGGSQSKHTAVNGLSDVDALAVINDSSLSGQSPETVIRQMAERIRQRLPQTNVSTGDMAVTIKYSDGIESRSCRRYAPNRGSESPIPRLINGAMSYTQNGLHGS